MAMIPSDYNPYGDPFGDYGRPPRSREEYEYMKMKQMYEREANRIPNPTVATTPPKPAFLNPKLLLTKGS